MAAPFPLYNPETAPEASRPVLADVQADFGMIPNLEKVLSASPVALTAYATLWSLFDKTSLSAIERQVVNDLPLSQSKLEALRRFTREMILSKGHPPEGELDAFFAAGYESVHALEVIVGLATKLISNYTNGIAGTPLDPQVKHLAWSKEKGEGQ